MEILFKTLSNYFVELTRMYRDYYGKIKRNKKNGIRKNAKKKKTLVSHI